MLKWSRRHHVQPRSFVFFSRCQQHHADRMENRTEGIIGEIRECVINEIASHIENSTPLHRQISPETQLTRNSVLNSVSSRVVLISDKNKCNCFYHVIRTTWDKINCLQETSGLMVPLPYLLLYVYKFGCLCVCSALFLSVLL